MQDFIIVGGGMVGASLALGLAQQGYQVSLFERSSPAEFDANAPMALRVSALNLGSEALLEKLGVWPTMQAMRMHAYRRLAVWEGDALPLEFSADAVQREHLGHIVENDVVQIALWQALRAHANVQIHMGESLIALEQAEHSCQLTTDQQTLLAHWLIAADGSQSQLRQLAGIGVRGWQYQQSCLVTAVKLPKDAPDITWQRFSPSGPRAFLPLANQQASLVWYDHANRVKQLKNLTHAELKQEIIEHFPSRLPEFEIQQVTSFPLTRQHANAYGNGRVLLAGDAAHAINPLAGQGVNLGFKDVACLLELFAGAQHQDDWWQYPVLDAYARKRRPHNSVMMSAMDACYTVFSNQNPLLHGLRQTGLGVLRNVKPLQKLVNHYACGLW